MSKTRAMVDSSTKAPRFATTGTAFGVGQAACWLAATAALLLACSSDDATTVGLDSSADPEGNTEENADPVYTGPLPPPEPRPEFRPLAGEGLDEPPRPGVVTPPGGSASSDALLDRLGAFLGSARDAGPAPAFDESGDAGPDPVDAGLSTDAG